MKRSVILAFVFVGSVARGQELDTQTAQKRMAPGSVRHHRSYRTDRSSGAGGSSSSENQATSQVRSVEPVQPFLYLTDPAAPTPETPIVSYSLGLSDGSNALRPLAAAGTPGSLVHVLGVEVGVASRTSVFATAMIAQPIVAADVSGTALRSGARIRLLDGNRLPAQVTLEGAAMREFGGAMGGSVQVAGSYDLGAVRLAAAARADHMVGEGRNPVDLFAVIGASCRIAAPVRVGLEYVAQDLEDLVEEDRFDGHMHQYVGPNAALSLNHHRLLLTAGTAVEIGVAAPSLLGRATLVYVY